MRYNRTDRGWRIGVNALATPPSSSSFVSVVVSRTRASGVAPNNSISPSRGDLVLTIFDISDFPCCGEWDLMCSNFICLVFLH